ncbi:DUF202 domain-containing protein [Streptomyces sp. SP17BM10]|uniref:YidH family protein n=1 Tax=Streptomyces sp. SP17BM10 TaxID=3002530 RepID=UPI002E7A8252|nr:DUF202 domain-containing protein [Streptomyces sp. SP17BM10]MEE1786664.1 DUF202 domain-containing protein [Streptomyces sp. SP17BM10]
MAEASSNGLDGDGGTGPWWERGREPDYRATLANERTFLAWSRTALALLASSLAVLQLVTGVPEPLRVALSCLLAALSLTTAVVGYVQWRVRQERMRMGRPLGHLPVQAVLTAVFVLLTAVVGAVIVLAPGGR